MPIATKTYRSVDRLTDAEVTELKNLMDYSQVSMVLLGSKIGANFNIDTDQAISINNASKYIIRKIVVTNASVNMTTAVGGIYTAASKGGSTIVANSQVYSALTGATLFVDLTLDTTATTTALTGSSVYLSLTTKQGAAATGDVFIFGDILA